MPIYEFACPRCRLIFSFLSKRVQPTRKPACPKCGHKKLVKEISPFAAIKGSSKSGSDSEAVADPMDDPRMASAMNELERDMSRMDENNPKHMAHVMSKMKELLPPGTMPKEMDAAIKRLAAGEDPEKIEEDMGDVLGDFAGEDPASGPGGSGPFGRDPGLYDF